MGLKGRVRKLEENRRSSPEPPCPECGNTIRTITVCEGGWYLYEGWEPCSLCDVRPREKETEEEKASSGLVEDLHGDRRQRITRIYVTCTDGPFEVPDLEDIEPGDVLQAPDGTLYRREA